MSVRKGFKMTSQCYFSTQVRGEPPVILRRNFKLFCIMQFKLYLYNVIHVASVSTDTTLCDHPNKGCCKTHNCLFTYYLDVHVPVCLSFSKLGTLPTILRPCTCTCRVGAWELLLRLLPNFRGQKNLFSFYLTKI